MELLNFIFQSFWVWLGFIILIGIPIDAICKIISRLIRKAMVNKHGWPININLDADGDWHKIKEDKNE